MKRLIINPAIVFFLVLTAFHAAAQTGPGERISLLKKAIVTDFWFGWHNDVGRPLTIELIEEIGDEESFDVEVIDNENNFTADKLEGAEVLVLQNMSAPNRLSDASKSVIIDFVENGGGLFSIHSTMDMMQGGIWDWLDANVTHGRFTGGHVGGDPADVYIDSEAYDADSNLHPILEGLDSLDNVDVSTGLISDWIGKWFWWENKFRGGENITILLTVDPETYACECPELGGDQPALWVTDNVGGPDGGSTSHILVGGSNKMFAIAREKGIKTVWKNTLQYLAGYEPPVSSLPGSPADSFGFVFNAKERRLSVSSRGRHTVTVMNVSGETVYEKTGYKNRAYDVYPAHDPGIYIVRVSSEGKSVSRRIILF